jgi:hypothetical protein
MILAINKKKLRKKILLHGILSALIVAIAILIPVLEAGSTEKKGYEIILAVAALLFIAAVTALPILHLIRVRNEFGNIIRFENGILQDFSGILNYKRRIPIENIESINFGILSTQIGNSNQLILKIRNVNRTKNPLFDQLKGRVVYITDYFVDKTEFEKLAQELQ